MSLTDHAPLAEETHPRPTRVAWLRWIRLVLAASPALLPLMLIIADGVNVFYWDEWSPYIVGLLYKAHERILTLSDFTIQHNEHRIVIPKLIYLISGLLSGGNVKVLMFLQWIVVSLTSLGVLWLMVQTDRPADERPADFGQRLTGAIAIKWFLANMMMYTISAWENWLFSLGLVNVLPMAFIVAALVVLASPLRGWMKTTLAIALACAGTFSAGSGMAVWLLAGAPLAWSGSRRQLMQKKWMLVAWAITFIVCLVLYFHGFHSTHPANISASPPSLLDRLNYFLVFQAGCGTYTSSVVLLTWFGGFTLGLYLAAGGYFLWLWIGRRQFELCGRMLIWLAIGGFTIVTGLLGAAFRAGLGIQQAASSRYATYAAYISVSLIVLVPMICADIRSRWRRPDAGWQAFWTQLPAFLGGPLILTQALGWIQIASDCRFVRLQRLQAKAVLMTMQVFPAPLQLAKLVTPEQNVVADWAPRLNAAGYLHPPMLASPDALDDQDNSVPLQGAGIAGTLEQLQQASTEMIVATGWAILPGKGQPAQSIVLSYEDAQGRPILFALCTDRFARPEIAENYGLSSDLLYGWSANFAINLLPADLKVIKLRAWAIDTDTGKLLPLAGEISLSR